MNFWTEENMCWFPKQIVVQNAVVSEFGVNNKHLKSSFLKTYEEKMIRILRWTTWTVADLFWIESLH